MNKNKDENIVNKITNYQTTNKSDRNINKQFDLKQFNYEFEESEANINKTRKANSTDDLNKNDEILENVLPHKKPIQYIIINIREMFYIVLEMLVDKKNPLPYLFSTPDRQFSLAIFLIVIGGLLLLFSNIMISS
jgi:hypothetical protein